jgi:3-hydroxybutyryl-CoA dehydratase
MTEAEFHVEVTEGDAARFAELSGDWNPLHTDAAYAAETAYRRPILHGAFSAGLVSRMAGMHLPGRDCLLHGMKLRFTSPIVPPARLKVRGKIARESGGEGSVEVGITDAASGQLYVEASYEFGRHKHGVAEVPSTMPETTAQEAVVLVTGASGGLAAALLKSLGGKGLGTSRSGAEGALAAPDLFALADQLAGRKLAGIVHCGWPMPDNQRLTALGSGTRAAIGHHIAAPLAEMVALAQLLASHGTPGATLVLVGSSFAEPGRHAWRMPLYSLAKSLVPRLVEILALELGAQNRRCVGVIFDVIADAGMNAGMREAVKLTHADRAPSGELASMNDAAGQIRWVLENDSRLVSGAVISLSGGAVP